MKNDHFTFTATDGAQLFVYRWRPDVEIGKAVIHIAHGLAEHAGRYERLAEELTSQGYLVYANDHRGHGKTAGSNDNLGFCGERNCWNRMVQDLIELCAAEKRENPSLRLTLFGHSMGSAMAQQAICEDPAPMDQPGVFDAVVMSGANGTVSPLVHLGKIIARIERLRLGARGRSNLINSLSFDNFNKPFAPNRTAFDWLSRDEREVDRYIADPLCGFIASVQFWVDFLAALPEIARTDNRRRIRPTLPIYLFSGGDDPVNENARGCEALARAYREIGLKNISYKIYPYARHETLNELNRDQVVADFVDWLEAVRMLARAA
ncbi:MAG: alpha/beta hydrolase [Blastocatellia bacterium]|nr:alpha/beta hydrolase [Blastocatellia bacterium]